MITTHVCVNDVILSFSLTRHTQSSHVHPQWIFVKNERMKFDDRKIIEFSHLTVNRLKLYLWDSLGSTCSSLWQVWIIKTINVKCDEFIYLVGYCTYTKSFEIIRNFNVFILVKMIIISRGQSTDLYKNSAKMPFIALFDLFWMHEKREILTPKNVNWRASSCNGRKKSVFIFGNFSVLDFWMHFYECSCFSLISIFKVFFKVRKMTKMVFKFQIVMWDFEADLLTSFWNMLGLPTRCRCTGKYILLMVLIASYWLNKLRSVIETQICFGNDSKSKCGFPTNEKVQIIVIWNLC